MAMIVAHRANFRYTDDPEAGIDYSRVVHGEQKFIHHRPIVAGDRLVTVLTVDSIRSAGRPQHDRRCAATSPPRPASRSAWRSARSSSAAEDS